MNGNVKNSACPNGLNEKVVSKIGNISPVARIQATVDGGVDDPTIELDDNLESNTNFFGDGSPHIVARMIDSIRHTAGISHEKSQIAVQKVLEILQGRCLQAEVVSDIALFLSYLEEPSAISRVPEMIANSRDAQELGQLFLIVCEITHDEQQRSWAVHDDEDDIQKVISNIHSILLNADQSISKHVMKSEQYINVQTLALFYQMETRESIRSSLRNVFMTICQIDRASRSVFANSILPMELAREFQDCTTDRHRLLGISKLLTQLIGTEETLPLNHFEHLGTDFVTVVLKVIEQEADDDGTLQNELTNTLIALNYQHNGCPVTIQAISKIQTAPYFSQRLINLLNWGEEPLDAGNNKVNSVLNFLINIFRDAVAAELFYTNDVKVLIDICIRWLTDLTPGDKRRLVLLSLIKHILINTDYSVHLHRKLDLMNCLGRFFMEDQVDSGLCQIFIIAIYDMFPFLKLNPTGDSQSSDLC